MTTITALQRLEKQRYRSYRMLDKARAGNPELQPYFESATNLWLSLRRDVEARELKLAERKDAREVLFEVFTPNDYQYSYRHTIRTPHRLIQTAWTQTFATLRKSAGDHFASDFAEAMRMPAPRQGAA